MAGIFSFFLDCKRSTNQKQKLWEHELDGFSNGCVFRCAGKLFYQTLPNMLVNLPPNSICFIGIYKKINENIYLNTPLTLNNCTNLRMLKRPFKYMRLLSSFLCTVLFQNHWINTIKIHWELRFQAIRSLSNDLVPHEWMMYSTSGQMHHVFPQEATGIKTPFST